MSTPQSVPSHIANLDPTLWSPVADTFDWKNLDLGNVHIVSGSAFINVNDPFGLMGNPFSVVLGDKVANLDEQQCEQIVQMTGTPETVFVRECQETGKDTYQILLTVLTPTGKELGACAHGFTGAVQALLQCGRLKSNAEVVVRTTINTEAKVYIASDTISLEFVIDGARTLLVNGHVLEAIFRAEIYPGAKDISVLSVGSPKLIVETTPQVFDAIQAKLAELDYDKLLEFEEKEHINGIHIFCRSPDTQLPQKTIQVNAYLGRHNVVDPATGVSAAAQLSGDMHVDEGVEVTVTQYTAKGPSAILKVKKGKTTMLVGGTAVLFNCRQVDIP